VNMKLYLTQLVFAIYHPRRPVRRLETDQEIARCRAVRGLHGHSAMLGSAMREIHRTEAE